MVIFISKNFFVQISKPENLHFDTTRCSGHGCSLTCNVKYYVHHLRQTREMPVLVFVFIHVYFRHTGQRDFKCGVCDFFGYTFTDIRKHIERRHTEMKTLICDKCGQTFKSEFAFQVSLSS